MRLGTATARSSTWQPGPMTWGGAIEQVAAGTGDAKPSTKSLTGELPEAMPMMPSNDGNLDAFQLEDN